MQDNFISEVERLIRKSKGYFYQLTPLEREWLSEALFELKCLDLKITPQKIFKKVGPEVDLSEHYKKLESISPILYKNNSEVIKDLSYTIDERRLDLFFTVAADSFPTVLSSSISAKKPECFFHAPSLQSLEKITKQLLVCFQTVILSYHWPVEPCFDENGNVLWGFIDPDNFRDGILVPFTFRGKSYSAAIERNFEEWLLNVKRGILSGDVLFLPCGMPRSPDPEEVSSKHKRIIKEEYIDITSTSMIDYFRRAEGWNFEKRNNFFQSSSFLSNNAQEVLSIEFPFLENISLTDILKIREDENDAFIHFTAGLTRAVEEIRKNEPLTKHEIRRIQHEYIEDGIALLNLRLKKISKFRTLRMAGCLLTTGTLIISAITGAQLPTIATTALGSGGMALLFREYAEYLKDKSQLKEDERYFIWKIGKNN